MSVSYTHLDVYKRQAVGSRAAIQIGEQNIEILTTDTDVVCTVRNGKRRDLLAGNGTDHSDHTPVSYTHLCKSLPFQHGHRLRGAAAPGWENDLY